MILEAVTPAVVKVVDPRIKRPIDRIVQYVNEELSRPWTPDEYTKGRTLHPSYEIVIEFQSDIDVVKDFYQRADWHVEKHPAHHIQGLPDVLVFRPLAT